MQPLNCLDWSVSFTSLCAHSFNYEGRSWRELIDNRVEIDDSAQRSKQCFSFLISKQIYWLWLKYPNLSPLPTFNPRSLSVFEVSSVVMETDLLPYELSTRGWFKATWEFIVDFWNPLLTRKSKAALQVFMAGLRPTWSIGSESSWSADSSCKRLSEFWLWKVKSGIFLFHFFLYWYQGEWPKTSRSLLYATLTLLVFLTLWFTWRASRGMSSSLTVKAASEKHWW